ncbi:hypothetical protein YC2023_051529 [Brassica napus]
MIMSFKSVSPCCFQTPFRETACMFCLKTSNRVTLGELIGHGFYPLLLIVYKRTSLLSIDSNNYSSDDMCNSLKIVIWDGIMYGLSLLLAFSSFWTLSPAGQQFSIITCNCCLGMKLVNHKCLQKSLETKCPLCCEFRFISTEQSEPYHLGKWVKIMSVPQSERNMQIISSEISFILTISYSFLSQSHFAKVYFRKLDVLLAAEELKEYKIVR